MRTRPSSTDTPRSGAVLIAVLIVVVLLTLAAFQFSELMYQEYSAAHSTPTSLKARACADSGIASFTAMVSDKDTLTSTLGNNPYDNESYFARQQVTAVSNNTPTGRYSLVSAYDKDDPNAALAIRYGAIDESGKINPNALMQIDSTGQVLHDWLMKLPNMTDEI